MSARFRVNEPRVVHEIIGGEAVIVNLANGNYYSADGAGAEVWRLIESGPSAEEIADVIVALYEVDHATADADVAAFLDALRNEEIIVLSDEDDEFRARRRPDAPASKLPYETPCLETYSDMQEMIALDPIHEVDATGWPKREP
jgi:hypothetical protein